MRQHSTFHDLDHPLRSEAQRIAILAPTLPEYWAVRILLPRACIYRTGVGMARRQKLRQGSIVVVCGLAGALVSGLSPGTILIPEWVGLANGKTMACDPGLVQTLVTATRSLHWQLSTGPLLTASSLIVGSERSKWTQHGFVAVDMETGLLAEQDLHVAAIRVILDTPEHEISSDWLHPEKAFFQAQHWKELWWLSSTAPRYMLRVARVIKTGLGNGF